MITFEEAFHITINSAVSLPHETVNINHALGRVLADDIISDINLPPFNKSAMDGFACRFNDINAELKVIETIPAGYAPQLKINKGECSKIMTGAIIPDGADCVIIVEDTQVFSCEKIKFTGSIDNYGSKDRKSDKDKFMNICYLGEDLHTGDTVLKKGETLKPEHIAVLATVGCTKPTVYALPKIGVISTGSELVEPCEYPGTASIRNSNGYQIVNQIKTTGAIATYYGIAEDTLEATDLILKKAIEENDVILISGGVSMGEFDFVKEVISNNGLEILFDKVAVQPGKPTTFAKKHNKYCFGLPGNPVSSFVQFEILVKPFIYRLMGNNNTNKMISLPIGKEITRRRGTRKAFIPGILDPSGKVYPVEYHGSAHINALTKADCLIEFPIDKLSIKANEKTNITFL